MIGRTCNYISSLVLFRAQVTSASPTTFTMSQELEASPAFTLEFMVLSAALREVLSQHALAQDTTAGCSECQCQQVHGLGRAVWVLSVCFQPLCDSALSWKHSSQLLCFWTLSRVSVTEVFDVSALLNKICLLKWLQQMPSWDLF